MESETPNGGCPGIRLVVEKKYFMKITAQKNCLYQEVRKLKEEIAEAETVKRCVEQAIPPTEQRKEKSKGQDISL